MAKIVHDKENCIGCGSCAAICPAFWEMNYDEAKAALKNGKKNGKGEYEIEIKNIGCNKEAVEICPTQVIKII